MVVQNQEELGEGSTIPTDPQHTHTIIQPLTYQPQKTQKPRKPKIKDTQVPQPSGPTKHVADEAVHKELGDNLVRVATTASSLEAEQDSGNTLQSDENRLKLNELMELSTNLQKKVVDLEKTKTTQANEIASLKRRVKKLEQKKRSRTYDLKRLRKVGATTRVESSSDKEDLGEDASKQGKRINVIDADEDITLVNVQNVDEEMFYMDALDGEEVFVTGKKENVALEALKTSKPKVKGIVLQEPSESTTATTISSQGLSQDKGKGILVEPKKPLKKKDQLKLDEDITLKLQAEINKQERITKAKEEKIDEANIAWDDIQSKEENALQLKEQRRRGKPPIKTQQKKIMITYLKNMEGWKHNDLKSKDFNSIKELFDKAFTRVNMFVDFRTMLVESSSKRAGEELEQENTKKQKVDEDKDTVELQSLMEVILDEEEVAIDVVPLATMSPSNVDLKIHKEGKQSHYQIVRADGKSQMYRVFSQMLKSFTREALEDLYKLVKAKYGSKRPVEDLDLVLWNDLKTMFEPPVEDEI
ncbi:hypothetical protein Tco_0227802 [Tanacetum coccineum]